eukprot:TRINITY_DN675_c0_g1_i1.p1 TRINITY_DN675_c0_g1~~TRINITY_DN675_c0_g1_i1.p1  ORF type:complete len:560 (-),score=136.57 TRINITY_DN675_c0_g1_i1:551-2230(-)
MWSRPKTPFFTGVRQFSTGKQSYDAIVVGGGHNGLISAAYLAKAGKKVLVLEKRHLIGGAAITEEIVPGFKFSRCSYVSGLMRPQIIKDLKLKDYGLKFHKRMPSSFTPMLDGRYLLMGGDSKLTLEEISKFSKKDAEAYPEYEKMLEKIGEFFEPFLDEDPPNLNLMTNATPKEKANTVLSGIKMVGRMAKLGKHLPSFVELMTAPASKVLKKWFESEPLLSTLATDSIIGAMTSPNQIGSGYVLLHHVMGITEGERGVWSYVEGGMGALSQSIAKSAESLGAEIRVNSPIKSILVDSNNTANGVLLENGERISSKVVLSNATPYETFINLCPKDTIPKPFSDRIKNLDWNSAVTKINVALDKLPNFKAYPTVNNQPGPQHKGTIHLCRDLAHIEESYREALAGKSSSVPIIEMTIPSSVDRTISPEGKHVALLFVQYTPNQLAEGSWADPKRKEEFADRVFDVIEQYAPGFKKSVVGRDILSPYDLEKIFGLTGGNIFHSALGLDQLFSMRPAPGFSNYSTPVKNLYLCGSGAHPGGGVMGACGRNAANRVLNDVTF